MLLLLGIFGYVMRKFNFELAPMVVAFVLGPMIEKHLREGLFLSQGNIGFFLHLPNCRHDVDLCADCDGHGDSPLARC